MKNIRILLDRYWEGETTLEEERELKTYFNCGQIADEFRGDAAFFQAMQQEKQVQLAHKAARVPMPVHWSARSYASLAAAVLLLLVAGLWLLKKPAPFVDMAQQTAPRVISEHDSATQVADIQVNKLPERHQTEVLHSTKKVKKRQPKPLQAAPDTDVVMLHSTSELDPETRQALEEIRAALALVSSKISKGKKAAARQINHVETLDKFIKKKGDI